MPQAGEEHGSPGHRYGCGITGAGKGPLAGRWQREGGFVLGKGWGKSPRAVGLTPPRSWEGKGPHLPTLWVGTPKFGIRTSPVGREERGWGG